MNEKSAKVEYWLKTIKSRARDSLVVIVGTHRDDKRCDKRHREQIIRKMRARYDSRFPFVKDYACVSCKTGKGINKLKALLTSLATKYKHDNVPQSYLLLEGRLRAKRLQTQVLSHKQFVSFAKECGVTDKQMAHCMDFMSDAGVIVYFSDEKKDDTMVTSLSTSAGSSDGLSDIVVLDPQWITNLMSSVITLKHSYAKEGLLPTAALPQIWKQYPREQYEWLLKLLERFEISHRLDPAVAAGLLAVTALAGSSTASLSSPLHFGNTINPLSNASSSTQTTPAGSPPTTRKVSAQHAISAAESDQPVFVRHKLNKQRSAPVNLGSPPLTHSHGSDSDHDDSVVAPVAEFILVPSLLPDKPDPSVLRESWEGAGIMPSKVPRMPQSAPKLANASAISQSTPSMKTHSNKSPSPTRYIASIAPTPPKFVSIVGRRYRFKFLPLGFFSRLIVRLIHLPKTRPLYYWKSGIVMEIGNERALIEYNEIEYQLDFFVKRRGSDAIPGSAKAQEEQQSDISLVRVLVESIETLVMGFYKLRPRVFVPCSHCLTAKYLRSSTDSRYDEQQMMMFSYPKPYDRPENVHVSHSSTSSPRFQEASQPIAVGTPRRLANSGSATNNSDSPPSALSGSPVWAPATLPLDMGEINNMTSRPVPALATSSVIVPVVHSYASTVLDVHYEECVRTTNDEDPPGLIVPYFFPIEECTLAVREGTSALVCCRIMKPTNDKSSRSRRFKKDKYRDAIMEIRTTVELSELCPDIAFKDVEGLTIEFSSLELLAKVAEGGSSELHKARLKSSSSSSSSRIVAVKMLKNQTGVNLLSESFRALQHETFVMRYVFILGLALGTCPSLPI
jgi:hypothetical protein